MGTWNLSTTMDTASFLTVPTQKQAQLKQIFFLLFIYYSPSSPQKSQMRPDQVNTDNATNEAKQETGPAMKNSSSCRPTDILCS